MDDPSSIASSPATSSSRFTGALAAYQGDIESWQPSAAEADDVISSVAAYCRDYCPARLACVEEHCRLFRLEERAALALPHSPSERVGVVGAPVIAL